MQPIVRHDKGFSLVELMIAMVIFTIAMLGVLAGLNSAIYNNKSNAEHDEAINVAEEEMNRLKDEQFLSPVLNATAWAQPKDNNGNPIYSACPASFSNTSRCVAVNMRSGITTYAVTETITDIAVAPNGIKQITIAVGWNGKGGWAAQAPTNANYQHVISSVIVQD